jgi:hypothetical protein
MNRDKPERLPGFRRRSSLRKIPPDISQRLQFPLPSAKLANKVKERANKEKGQEQEITEETEQKRGKS